MGSDLSTSADETPAVNAKTLTVVDELKLSSVQMFLVRKMWNSARSADLSEPGRSVLRCAMSRIPEMSPILEKAAAQSHVGMGSARTEEAEDSTDSDDVSRYVDAPTTTRPVLYVGPGEVMLGPIAKMKTAGMPFKARVGNKTMQGYIIQHAVAFTSLIDSIVTSLENQATVIRRLETLGFSHYKLKKIGFHPRYWNVFGEALLQLTQSWSQDHKRNILAYDAWSRIILFLVSHMRQGYLRASAAARKRELHQARARRKLSVVTKFHSMDRIDAMAIGISRCSREEN